MPGFTVTRTSNKSIDALWKVLDDYPNIATWNSGLKGSHSTSVPQTGIGARRHCDLSPAGSLEEIITGYEEGRRMSILIEQLKGMPLKTATADFLLAEGPDGVTMQLRYEFVASGGALARVTGPALVKPLKKGFTQFLKDWDAAA